MPQRRLQGTGMTGPLPVCIDLQPYAASQAPDRADILFVAEVEAVEL